jgi:hypothetical protein
MGALCFSVKALPRLLNQIREIQQFPKFCEHQFLEEKQAQIR